MGRIKELIKSFINPIEPEKSFDELAVAAGIGEADLKMLKNSMGGVLNWKFAEDCEETKKKKSPQFTRKETQVQPTTKQALKEKDNGIERD